MSKLSLDERIEIFKRMDLNCYNRAKVASSMGISPKTLRSLRKSGELNDIFILSNEKKEDKNEGMRCYLKKGRDYDIYFKNHSNPIISRYTIEISKNNIFLNLDYSFYSDREEKWINDRIMDDIDKEWFLSLKDKVDELFNNVYNDETPKHVDMFVKIFNNLNKPYIYYNPVSFKDNTRTINIGVDIVLKIKTTELYNVLKSYLEIFEDDEFIKWANDWNKYAKRKNYDQVSFLLSNKSRLEYDYLNEPYPNYLTEDMRDIDRDTEEDVQEGGRIKSKKNRSYKKSHKKSHKISYKK
jgi:hypothetical protein